MVLEAQIMEYLRAQGYPVPAVHQISEDGTDLVMERIVGPTMMQSLGRSPWKIRPLARELATLHVRLHDIAAPDFLPRAEIGYGDSVIHMDLHPLNVIISPNGPVVIDWARAARGGPDTDVALAWALMAAADVPGGRAKAKLLGLGRSMLVDAFVANFDRTEIAAQLHDIVEWKARDEHMNAKEIEGMRQLVRRAVTNA
jgi:aminoglycoside phosphotransferase (APT) family kinase protein